MGGIVKVNIIGAGAWGTALGISAARAGSSVTLWSRNSDLVEQVTEHHTHPRLQAVTLPDSMMATTNLAAALDADLLILSVTAPSYRSVALEMKDTLKEGTPLILAAKGIEQKTGALMSEVIGEILPQTPLAILSGPNFATEVANNLPAAASLACDETLWPKIKTALSHTRFRLYHSEDSIGVQLGGALKNVIAIACGILKNQELGENAMAALVTRSLAEITRLGVKMGAHPETFSGLSGMGDLVLTCMGSQSRNLKFGEGLSNHYNLHKDLMKSLKTVEGVPTAASIMTLAKHHHVDMPVCQAVYDVLYENASVQATIVRLLSRPLKAEVDPGLDTAS